MAKATKTTPQEMILANPQGKTVEELKEIVKSLQAQVNQYQEMATKSKGALEVILQMIPREEVEKMIAQENKINGEVVDDG
jgi:uncharacterized ferredoxin-like protein